METTTFTSCETVHSLLLVASSNAFFREKLLDTLQTTHWSVEEASGGADALAKLDDHSYQALLLDSWLADLEVSELIRLVRARRPKVDIFLFDAETGRPHLPDTAGRSAPARELFRLLQESGFVFNTQRVGSDEPMQENVSPEAVPQAEPLPGMIGSGQAMEKIYRLVRLVAPRNTTTLITGETGTGKELVAHAIHALSARAKKPFVVVNCSAIPEALLESELFGYVRGAFTGAVQSRLGLVHAAHNGTLFLDEVGDLPYNLQAKLLRFLQEGEVQRLGASEVGRVDVRVVAATNTDLRKAVEEGKFRQDLYYRLSVFPLEVPPLRKRPEDILPLAESFLEKFCEEASLPCKILSAAANRFLQDYRWPGNVRELQHSIERAFILAEENEQLLPLNFPSCLQKS